MVVHVSSREQPIGKPGDVPSPQTLEPNVRRGDEEHSYVEGLDRDVAAPRD
jgi:hypothetical protein